MRCGLILLGLVTMALGCGDSEEGGTDASRDATTEGGVDAQVEGDGGLDGAMDAAVVELDTRYLPMAKPGTRLQPRVFQVEGAPDVFAGWFDSELGVDCEPGTTLDGSTRCVPTDMVSPELVRLSENCTGGSGLLDLQQCGPTTYQRLGEELADEFKSCENNGFGVEVESYATEAWSGSYSSMNEGECTVFAEAPEGAVSLLERTVQAPATFVAFSYRFEQLDNGLQVRFEESEDGASRVMGLHNEDGQACSLRPLARGAHYCVPSQVAFEEGSGTYLDSECTKLVAYVSSSYDVECDGEPRYGLVRGDEGSDVYQLGAERTGDDVVYVRDGENCAARSVTELTSEKSYVGRVFEISDTLASLPRLLPVALGDGTARARYYATPEGVVAQEAYNEVLSSVGSGLRVRTVYEQDGEGCALWPTANDGPRCLPVEMALDVAVDPRFADDACTERVGYVGTWTTRSGEDPEFIYTVEQSECVRPQGAAFSTTEVVTGLWQVTGRLEEGAQTIYEKVDDACVEVEANSIHFTVETVETDSYLQPTETTLMQ